MFNLLNKKLVRGVTKDDILKVEFDQVSRKNKVTFRGTELSREQITDLKSECEEFEKSFFWQEVCKKQIRYQAQVVGMEKSQSLDDLKMCQAMILNLDILDQIIREIKAL